MVFSSRLLFVRICLVIALIVCSAFRRLGDDALLQLLHANVAAERLNLATQNIVDEEFLFVTDFASAHRPGITTLHLDDNDIACPEVEKASFPSTLERLKLDDNRRLTPSAAVGAWPSPHTMSHDVSCETVYLTAFGTQIYCSALRLNALASAPCTCVIVDSRAEKLLKVPPLLFSLT